MKSEVMTALGPIPANQLGITLMHEHFTANLYRATADANHFLCDIPLAIREARRFRDAGGASVVDVTNRGLGRNPTLLRRVAQETGLHVIMGCGWYREPYYEEEVYTKTTNQIADEIVRDITEGVNGTGVKAGIIGEIGCHRHYILPAEERLFRAAARAHKQTGLTITTHAVRSPVGLDQLDLLQDETVDLRRVIVGHCDTYPDPQYHEAVARRGAYVEFDTIRGESEWDSQQRVECVEKLIDKGYLNQILLSHDVCMKSHLHAYGGEGYDYLLTGFIPRLLERGLTQEQAQILLVENPRNALTGE